MLSITKLQNLKAIHNQRKTNVSEYQVVINHKTTKFESNSQPPVIALKVAPCCYQSQNYKIWKQFTTVFYYQVVTFLLLSITKLQNLKAIHNFDDSNSSNSPVVINHKTTKFESNSQHRTKIQQIYNSCYQSQNYKIWKQFTTEHYFSEIDKQLLSITKLQNLKAIHNCLAFLRKLS